MQRILVIVIIAMVGVLLFMAFRPAGTSLDSDDTMRLVRYGLIVALVGSGVVASQRNWGQAIRNLSIWALIILGLLTAYVYRGDAQEIASRVTAGLIPGRAASLVDEDGFNTVVLYKSQNGHYVADVMVDGSPITMMVDTGATTIALSYEDAARAGLNPQSLAFSSTVMTANGPARSANVTLPQISVGGIVRTNVRAGIAEPGKLETSLLGMNFLGSLSSVSFSGDELRLRD